MSLILKCDGCNNLRPDGDILNAVQVHGWVWVNTTSDVRHYCSKACYDKHDARVKVEIPPIRLDFSG